MFSRWLHLRLRSRAAYCESVRKLSSSSNSALIPLARDLLKGLGEGQVSLVKDEGTGVATITLNHPQKKNALSGKLSNICSRLGLVSKSEFLMWCPPLIIAYLFYPSSYLQVR